MEQEVRPQRVARIDGDRVLLVFPYDAALNAQVKQIPGWRFVREERAWSVPRSPQVDRWLEKQGFVLEGAALVNQKGSPPVEGSVAGHRTEPAPESEALMEDPRFSGPLEKLMPFQRQAILWALERRRIIVGDPTGLGKTIQALAILELGQAWPAIIVCPASLRLNWAAEAMRWVPGRDLVIVEGKRSLPIDPASIIIVGYNLLDPRLEDLLAFQPRSLVFDEMHALKNRQTKQTKAARTLAKVVPRNGLVIGLSATLVVNRPAELIEPLRVIGRFEDVGGNWHNFVRRYCKARRTRFGWDISGHDHLDELSDRLRKICYVRREKSEVAPQLPPIIESVVPIELDPESRQDLDRIEEDVASVLAEQAAEEAVRQGLSPRDVQQIAEERFLRARAAETLVRIGQLRKHLGLAKVDAALAWVEDWLAGTDQKIVLFAWHREVQEQLAAGLNAPMILGGQDVIDTERAKKRFQQDPRCRVIVCSLQAASEGHTLDAADAVALVELPWTPAKVDQAVGRVYGRLSNPHGAILSYLVAPGTIDDWLQEILVEKRQVMNAVIGGGTERQVVTSTGVSVAARLIKKHATSLQLSPRTEEPREVVNMKQSHTFVVEQESLALFDGRG